MTDPEQVAIQIVENFTGDEYWIDTEAAVVSIAAALRHTAEVATITERTRAVSIIRRWSLTKAERLGDIGVCDQLIALIDSP